MTTTSGSLTSAFRTGFAGTVFTPEDPGYPEARTVWNGTVTTRPALIARCHTASDIAAAVRLTRESGLPLAVRAGSHSVAGLSSCEGGVVIDLSAMRAVRVDPDRRVAVAEPGATWADYDAATAAHGLASTGGLISSTGVAGLTLGGGIGWLQRRYGLACDNLRAAQVATADGELIEADDALLWGLRGGGGNFGVVTRFEFDLHPVSTVVGGLLIWPFERGAEVLQAFREWAATAPEEASMLAAVNTAPPEPFVPAELQGQKAIAIAGCWCGDPDAGQEVLAPLRALGPAVDLFGPMPYPALQSMLDASAPYGLRNYFRNGFVADLTDEIIEVALERGAALTSPMAQIHFHHMGGAVSRFGVETSAFSGRDAGYTYNLIGTWVEPTEDALHIPEIRAVSEALRPLSMPNRYVNFDTEQDAEQVRSAYGAEIYDRLARLKRQYDPANLFRRNQNVQPAR
jgi:hypothetical protein